MFQAPFQSLRSQLLSAFALLAAALLMVQLAAGLSGVRARTDSEMSALARGVLLSSAATLDRIGDAGDRGGIETLVSRLGLIPDLEYAALIDASGNVIATTRFETRGLPSGATPLGSDLAGRGLRDPEVTAIARGRRILAAAPVSFGSPGAAEPLRYRLALLFDLDRRLAAETREVVDHVLAALLAAAAVLLLVWLLLERRVLAPLRLVADAVERFGAGDRAARSGLSGLDEVHRAGLTFDRMAAEVESTEGALSRTRTLFDAVLRSLPVGVIAFSRAERRLLFANPRWREFYGREMPPGMTYEELVAGARIERPDGTPYPVNALMFETVLRTGRPAEATDQVLVRADGVRLPLVVSAVPVRIEDGRAFDAVVLVAQDRRDLARAFAELRDWEERFGTVVEATGQVVYEWDLDTQRVRRSGSLRQVLGYEDLEAFGVRQWESRIHPEDREAVLAELEARVLDGERFLIEYRYRHADGRWLTIRDHGFFQRGAEGRVIRMLGTMADVTLQRSLESQLRHAQKMETVGTLAGGIAHDFNNQLTGVIGHLDLLAHELPAENPLQEHVRLAGRAAERCADLTRGLLAFSRRLASHPRPIGLNVTVDETAALLRRMLPATVRLDCELEHALWTVLADAGQIQQVLMNLCVNARDAMPDGGSLTLATRNVTLSPLEATRHPEARSGDFVEIEVRDTGCGIEPEKLSRIFEPFFTTKSVGEGTGLGLAMAYGIVTGHHGWIEVESAPGAGAAFRTLLPRARGTPAGIEGERRRRPRGGHETILVVDDEPAVRDLAARALLAAGYEVLAAADGEEAVAIYRRRIGGIQAVLLDLTMPGKPGRAVMAEILSLDPAARVVLSSGYSPDSGMLDSGAAAGFLPKPYALEPLLDAIRRALDAPAPSLVGAAAGESSGAIAHDA